MSNIRNISHFYVKCRHCLRFSHRMNIIDDYLSSMYKESSSALTDCSKWRRAPIQNDKGAHKMPRTITVFSGSPRDFCEGGMHNGAQCFHWRSKLRSHKHETNNTKAPTNHGILIEGHFVLDRNSKVRYSGGPQVPRGHSYISLKKRAQPI